MSYLFALVRVGRWRLGLVGVLIQLVSLSCQPASEKETPPVESLRQAATVPSGLIDSSVATGLTSPTSLALLPDGRLFVTEQKGKVKVIASDVLLGTAFIDLEAETQGDQERGLLGVAVDPNFATNRYVYFYHTAKLPTVHNRIIRVTASAGNPNVADVATKKTVLDLEDIETPQDTEVQATWHHGGQLAFGADGKLYVAVGDHRHSAYAQDDNSNKGKILRINVDASGNWSVPSDNPFCTTAGQRKCLNYRKGFRNPFTFTIRPGTNNLFVSDVGNNAWEEVDIVLASDPSTRWNFGWPTTEGDFSQTSFPSFKRPAHTYAHGTATGQGCSVVGAGFYPSSGPWPSQYHGQFFFMDFCGVGGATGGVMRTMDPDDTTPPNATTQFGTGLAFPIALAIKSDGTSLYYLQRGQATGVPTAGLGSVRKMGVAGAAPSITDHPQDVTAHAESGNPSENAAFTCGAAGTPTPTINWQRSTNGGSSYSDLGVTGGSYTKVGVTSADNGHKFRCRANNGVGGDVFSSAATLTVTANDSPVLTLDEPALAAPWLWTSTAAKIGYESGMVIGFAGSATDEEDGAMPASAFTWQVDYHHETHSHPHMPATSGIKSGTFMIPVAEDAAAHVWYRLYMWVTDSGGRTTGTFRDIYPSTFVSDMTWATKANFWPAGQDPKKDLSIGGNQIRLDGLAYPKGIGMHPGSTAGQDAFVTYNLNGACSGKFVADVGVDDEATTAGSVVFKVFLNGSGTPAYDSGVTTFSSAPGEVEVNVAGVNELKLLVTNGGDGNSNDHASWANARVTGCSSNPLAVRKRIGYYPIWNEAGDDLRVTYPQPPADVPWTKISHLKLAFAGVSSSFNCAFIDASDDAQPGWQTNAQNLISYRNSNYPGVKVLLSVGGWTMSHRLSAAMSSTNRTTFVNSCVSLMNTIGADGIDIDWEYPTLHGVGSCASTNNALGCCPSGTCASSSDPASLTATFDAFRANGSFGQSKLLSLAMHANRAGGSPLIPYEYQNLFGGSPRRLDWVSVIAYDYHGPWFEDEFGVFHVNFTAPYDESLQSMDYVVKGPNGVDDTTDGVGSGNKGRVVLGVPYFGPAWYSVATPGTSGVGNTGVPVTGGKISYGKAMPNFVNRYPNQCTVKTPTTGNVQNRYVYCSGSVGFCSGKVGPDQTMCTSNGGSWTTVDNLWLSHEDVSVVGTKADWIAAYNWGGMMWWTQGEDSDPDDLTKTIAARLAPGTNPASQYACNPASPTSSPDVCPGESYTLWQIGSTAVTIEAEHYDSMPNSGVSGEGFAYHDTTAGNAYTGTDYRNDDVDLQPTTDAGGGWNIGWTASGEWLEYSVNVQTAGTYTLDLRVAATATQSMHVELDGVTVGNSFAIPNTGGFQTFQTVSKSVNLTSGQKVMRVVFDTGSVNFNWIKVTTASPPSPPAAPTGVTATAGSGQVLIAWTASSGATFYTVKRSTTSGGSYASIGNTSATTMTDGAVSNGTTYYYVVSASNLGGESANSSPEKSATPTAPTWTSQDIGTVGLTGTFNQNGGIVTLEGAGADIWGTADALRFAYQNVSGDATITARVTFLENTNAWSKAGVMFRDGTAAGARNLFALVPGSTTNAFRFQSRTTTGGATTGVGAVLSSIPVWVRVTRAGNVFTGYHSTDGSNWTQTGTATVTLASTLQVGLAVTSHTTAALATATFDNVTITAPPPTPPPAPTGVTASPGNTVVDLTWNAASGATSYTVKRSLVSGGPYTNATYPGITGTTYQNTGLTNGTAYYYVVTASNGAGESGNSSQVSATPAVPSGPAAPTNLTASITTGDTAALSWTDNSGNETGFRIERKIGAGSWSTLTTKAANVTTHSDPALTVNTYTYRVIATGSPDSSPSNERTVVIGAPVADAHVRDGTSAGTNFGSATTLEMKNSTVAGNHRRAFIRFSLSGVTSTVSSAKVRVYGNSITTAKLIGVYAVSDITWGETTITWNNAPTIGAKQGSSVSVGTTAAFFELDVTSYVQAQKTAGASAVTLEFKQDVANNETPSSFQSKENTNDALLLVSSSP